MAKRFKTVTACGTFDRLHRGHKFFLQQAFAVGEHVLIGVTSKQFIKQKPLSQTILPYDERVKTLTQFLKQQALIRRATIFSLDDVYGPAVDKNSSLEAIIVTKETIEGAREVNWRRKQFGLPELTIVKVPLVKAVGQNVISSQSKRVSELLGKNLTLPNALRPALKKPLGELLEGPENNLLIAARKAKDVIEKENPPLIITVGDVVTRSFNELLIPLSLAIVDFRIKREERIKSLQELGFKKEKPDLTIENPPGTISSTLSKAIGKTIQQHNNNNNESFIIRVFGEEDLSVLPVIIFSPSNSAIFYGQPQEGIVNVNVDEVIKSRTIELLSKFYQSKSP